MKRIITVVSIAASLIFLIFRAALAASGISYKLEVEGTGIYPNDVIKVQTAVNGGGNILLKGTFNFGNWTFFTIPPFVSPTGPLGVSINNDVAIHGETDRNGRPLTRINGGFFSFYSPLPKISSSSVLPFTYVLPDPLPPGPKITIQGIHFDGALWTPIHLAYTSGATVSGNKITNCIPYGPWSFDPAYPDKFALNAGIVVGPWFAQNGISPGRVYREGAVTGLFKINNNDIDLENSIPATTLGQGIFVNWGTGITAKISDNTIANVSRNSIEVLDNHKVNGKGSVVVEGNDITTSEVGIPYPGPTTPNGIVFGWWLDTVGYDPDNNGLHVVMHNSIRTKGNTSVGIMAMADESLVLNNKIASEGAAAIGLAVGGSHCLIAHNKMEGTGNYAINVTPVALNAMKLDASYNFFQGNNYNLFDEALYDIHFAKGANHNILVGHSGSVSDEGADNSITSFNFRGKRLISGVKSGYTLSGRRGR
jgi:hypothetical protein